MMVLFWTMFIISMSVLLWNLLDITLKNAWGEPLFRAFGFMLFGQFLFTLVEILGFWDNKENICIVQGFLIVMGYEISAMATNLFCYIIYRSIQGKLAFKRVWVEPTIYVSIIIIPLIAQLFPVLQKDYSKSPVAFSNHAPFPQQCLLNDTRQGLWIIISYAIQTTAVISPNVLSLIYCYFARKYNRLQTELYQSTIKVGPAWILPAINLYYWFIEQMNIFVQRPLIVQNLDEPLPLIFLISYLLLLTQPIVSVLFYMIALREKAQKPQMVTQEQEKLQETLYQSFEQEISYEHKQLAKTIHSTNVGRLSHESFKSFTPQKSRWLLSEAGQS